MKLHDVSILDLDKEGSLLNDMDSMDGGGPSRTKVALDGVLGEGQDTKSKPLLVNQPSEPDSFARITPEVQDDESAAAA